MEKDTRLEWLEVVRSLAIVGAVLCHVTEGIYGFDLDYMSSISGISKCFAFIVFSLGRMGVPLFLLITGYLLLDRHYDDEAMNRFWKTKCLNMLITVEIWIVIYRIFLSLIKVKPFLFSELIREMLFLKDVNMSHFWYMPMILGIYVFIPIISNLLKVINVRKLIFPITLVVIYEFAVPIINVFLQIYEQEGIYNVLALEFSGGIYGVYLIMGYAVKKGIFKKIKIQMVMIIGILSYIATVALQLYAYQNHIAYKVWYDCGLLLISALCLFESISRCKIIYGMRFFYGLSKYSFAIYLIHNLFLLVFIPDFKSYLMMNPIKEVSLIIISIGGSWLVAYVISKIPQIGSKILYMR